MNRTKIYWASFITLFLLGIILSFGPFSFWPGLIGITLMSTSLGMALSRLIFFGGKEQ